MNLTNDNESMDVKDSPMRVSSKLDAKLLNYQWFILRLKKQTLFFYPFCVLTLNGYIFISSSFYGTQPSKFENSIYYLNTKKKIDAKKP